MKGVKAERITIRIGQSWESPRLHVLLTQEDDVVVARCLDFTVSSHGEHEQEALDSLAEAIKEYVLTAVENNAVDTILDPAPGKYWRMFNELEVRQSLSELNQSLQSTMRPLSVDNIQHSIPEIRYA